MGSNVRPDMCSTDASDRPSAPLPEKIGGFLTCVAERLHGLSTSVLGVRRRIDAHQLHEFDDSFVRAPW